MNEEPKPEPAPVEAKATEEQHPFNARLEPGGELTKQAAHDREHKCYGCLRQFRKAEDNLVCLREGVGVMRLCRECGAKDGTSRLIGAGVYVGMGGVQNLSSTDRERVNKKLKKLKRQAAASAKKQRRFIATTSPKKLRPPVVTDADGAVEKDR